MQNGLNLNAVPTSAQNVVIGAIIVLAVGIDMWRVEIGQALSFLSTCQRDREHQSGATHMTPPVRFCHIGITVPDLERAVEFYTKALGLYLIMAPTTIHHDDSAIGQMCDDVFGEGWGIFPHRASVDRRRHRHRAVRVPEDHAGADALRVLAPEDVPFLRPGSRPRGPRQAHRGSTAASMRMKQVRHYYPGQKPYRMVYCEDPFGNIVELYSHSYELTYSAGAYV